MTNVLGQEDGCDLPPGRILGRDMLRADDRQSRLFQGNRWRAGQALRFEVLRVNLRCSRRLYGSSVHGQAMDNPKTVQAS